MPEISPQIHKMVSDYMKGLRVPREYKGPKLKVDHLVSKFSFVYEKIRNAVEYQEEHLLRRSAIERGLKRRWQPKKSAQKISKSLVYDLIRGRYLPDDKLPETTIDNVAHILNKFIYLANISKHHIDDKQEKEKFVNWLISMCACEIEDLFAPPVKEDALITGMYEIFYEYIDFAKQKITEQEKSVQTRLAIMRALTKYDNILVSWNLFKQYCPEWLAMKGDATNEMARKIFKLKGVINQDLNHPMGERIMRFMQRHVILFLVIQDIMQKNKGNSMKIFSEHELLETEIIEACQKRYKKTKSKRSRATFRSFIYIFLTKMMMALALELPYDLYVVEHTNYLPISINVLFHPFLLFFVATTIQMPKAGNTQKIVRAIKLIVFKTKDSPLYQIKVFKATKKYLQAIFYLLYLIMFIISFGVIIYALQRLDFNIVSGVLFLFFITVISFFGLKMRQMVRELILIKKKEGFVARTINFLSLPILRAGRWLSSNIQSINLLVFVLDYIVERPFKKTIEVSEEFVEYVKEKEEEVY